jgi:hypothetical protein
MSGVSKGKNINKEKKKMKNKIVAYAVMMLLFSVSVSHAMNWGTEVSGSLWTMDGADFKKDMMACQKVNVPPGDTISLKLKQNKLGGMVSIFTESEKELGFGAMLGFGLMPQVSYELNWGVTNSFGNWKFTNKTSYIPVDIYLKYKPKDGSYGISGGVGAGYVMAKTDLSGTFSYLTDRESNSGSFTQKKIIPHIQVGGEYFLTKWLSLNAGVKYLFSGVVDNLTGNVTCTDNGGSSFTCGDPGTQKERLIMVKDSDGEHLTSKKSSDPLASDERPFKYDFSGLRINIALRAYF